MYLKADDFNDKEEYCQLKVQFDNDYKRLSKTLSAKKFLPELEDKLLRQAARAIKKGYPIDYQITENSPSILYKTSLLDKTFTNRVVNGLLDLGADVNIKCWESPNLISFVFAGFNGMKMIMSLSTETFRRIVDQTEKIKSAESVLSGGVFIGIAELYLRFNIMKNSGELNPQEADLYISKAVDWLKIVIDAGTEPVWDKLEKRMELFKTHIQDYRQLIENLKTIIETYTEQKRQLETLAPPYWDYAL